MAEERKLATILFADLAGSTALADEQRIPSGRAPGWSASTTP
jgi:hypothetical protein